MEPDTSDDALVRAVRSTWDTAHGTALIPARLQLLSVAARGAVLEVLVSDANAARFGFAAQVPVLDDGEDDGEPGSAEHWALWQVIVPFIEEIETDAVRRYTANAAGVRWVSAT